MMFHTDRAQPREQNRMYAGQLVALLECCLPQLQAEQNQSSAASMVHNLIAADGGEGNDGWLTIPFG